MAHFQLDVKSPPGLKQRRGSFKTGRPEIQGLPVKALLDIRKLLDRRKDIFRP